MVRSGKTRKKCSLTFPTVSLDTLAANGITPHTSSPKPVIVIVDDEITIAETLRTILMHAGYACFAVYDAPSALDLIRVVPPDLLLTDFVLPGMSGLTLAVQVAKMCPTCKVIIFSGLVSAVDMTWMSRRDNPDFVLLEKPLHPDVLLSRVDSLLQSSSPATLSRPGRPILAPLPGIGSARGA
jgi:DNA-binding response OmpR family regulator